MFSTLLGLVGNLTVTEKRITKEDLDSFINATSKYFVQYQRLNGCNLVLDQNIDCITLKLKDLQYDLREYELDTVCILNKNVQRILLKNYTSEELFLKYLDKEKIEEETINSIYPTDGIKGAKDIAAALQKIFADYQKVYNDNYTQIRSILLDTKALGPGINLKQLESSLKDLEDLYNDSKTSDVLALRLNTVQERLKTLAATEQTNSKSF